MFMLIMRLRISLSMLIRRICERCLGWTEKEWNGVGVEVYIIKCLQLIYGMTCVSSLLG